MLYIAHVGHKMRVTRQGGQGEADAGKVLPEGWCPCLIYSCHLKGLFPVIHMHLHSVHGRFMSIKIIKKVISALLNLGYEKNVFLQTTTPPYTETIRHPCILMRM